MTRKAVEAEKKQILRVVKYRRGVKPETLFNRCFGDTMVHEQALTELRDSAQIQFQWGQWWRRR